MSLNDHNNHYSGPVTQKALIEHNGKILLVQYPDGTSLAGKWDLPGGRVHKGESAVEGLRREVKEEIGVDIEREELFAAGVDASGEPTERYFVVYRARLTDPSRPLVPEAGEIGKIEWRDKKDFLSLIAVYPGVWEALKPFFE